jgi:putative glutamine amidotransferase
MPTPLIGITLHSSADPDRTDLDALLTLIAQGVEQAGGAPVFIPYGLREPALHVVFARLDGLLLSGGGDVDPTCYGAASHPTLGGVDGERDRVELALTRWAIAHATPLFGICRGAQVFNVALGGTLYQDLSQHPNAMRHAYAPQFTLRPHAARVEEDSRLAHILRLPIVDVNSMHHQACRVLAPSLRAVAFAPDGVVEAIEHPTHPFALAVQWHPECLTDMDEHLNLFRALVAAAR